MGEFHFLQNGVLWLTRVLDDDVSDQENHLSDFYNGYLIARFLNALNRQQHTIEFVAEVKALKDGLKLVINAMEHHLLHEFGTLVPSEWIPDSVDVLFNLTTAAKLITMTMYMSMKNKAMSALLAEVFSNKEDVTVLMQHIDNFNQVIVTLDEDQKKAVLSLTPEKLSTGLVENEKTKKLTDEFTAVQIERDRLLEKVNDLEAEVSEHSALVVKLKSRVKHFDMMKQQAAMMSPATAVQADILANKLDAANRIKEKLEENIATKNKELSALTTDYSELEDKYFDASRKLESLQENLKNVEEDRTKIVAELESHHSTSKNIKNDNQRLETIVNDLKQRIEYVETLEQEKENLVTIVGDLNKRIDEYNDVYAENERLRDELQHRPIDYSTSLDASLLSIKPLSDDLSLTDTDKSCLSKAEYENRVLELSHEVQLLSFKLEETKVAHQLRVAEIQKATEIQVKELEDFAQQLKLKLLESSKQMDNLKTETYTLQKRLYNLSAYFGQLIMIVLIGLFAVLMYFKLTQTPLFHSRDSMVKHLKALDNIVQSLRFGRN